MVLRTLSAARVKYTLVALTFVLLCLGYVFQGCELVLFSPDPWDHAMSCIARSHDIAMIKLSFGHCHKSNCENVETITNNRQSEYTSESNHQLLQVIHSEIKGVTMNL